MGTKKRENEQNGKKSEKMVTFTKICYFREFPYYAEISTTIYTRPTSTILTPGQPGGKIIYFCDRDFHNLKIKSWKWKKQQIANFKNQKKNEINKKRKNYKKKQLKKQALTWKNRKYEKTWKKKITKINQEKIKYDIMKKTENIFQYHIFPHEEQIDI